MTAQQPKALELSMDPILEKLAAVERERDSLRPDVLGKRKLAPPPEGMRLHGLDHLRAEKQLWEILLQKWLAKQPPGPPTSGRR